MDLSRLAREVAGQPRFEGESEEVIKKRKKRVGGWRWRKRYLKIRSGMEVKVKCSMETQRLLKTNPETVLEDLRNKANFFAQIEIREAVTRGEEVWGENEEGKRKR